MKNNKKLSIILAFILAVTMISGCDSSSDSKLEANDNSSEIITQVNANAEIPTDEEIFEMFETARKMTADSGTFNWGTDGVLYEKHTNETIEQFVNRYKLVFTDKYVERRFNVGGYVRAGYDSGNLILSMNVPLAQVFLFDSLSYYVVFDDITDDANYIGYETVELGDYGARGSDLSFITNEIEIIGKSENKIVIENTIQHYHFDMYDPELVCHIENGKKIIDGTYGGYDEKTRLPIIADDSRKGEVLSPTDRTPAWVTTTYEYNLILVDGKWKFDNFVLWG